MLFPSSSLQVEFLSVVQSVAALHDNSSVALAVRDSNLLRLLDTQDLQVRRSYYICLDCFHKQQA